jgi:hypothetical protein
VFVRARPRPNPIRLNRYASIVAQPYKRGACGSAT